MAGTADPNSPKGYPVHVKSCSATKTEVEEEVFCLMVLVSLGVFFLGSQGSCFLEEGWTSVSLWEVVSDFL